MSLDKLAITQGAGTSIGSIKKTENGNVLHVSRVAIDTDQLNFSLVTEISSDSQADIEGSEISCLGKSKIKITATSTIQGAGCDFKVLVKSLDGRWCITNDSSFQFSTVLVSGKYINGIYNVDTHGAVAFKLIVSPPDTGTVTVYACAV